MIYIFDHLPKTGGTTFNEAYLAGAFQPEEVLVLSGTPEGNQRDLKALLSLPAEERSKYKIIAGHKTGSLRAQFPEAKYLALVRHPVERVISSYLHAKHHPGAWEYTGRDRSDRNMGLGEFLRSDLWARPASGVRHNHQAWVLLGENWQQIAAAGEESILQAIRSRYHVVGYTEALELFLFYLHLTEHFPLVLFNNRMVRKERASFQPTPEDLAEVERYNQADLLVYQCVRKEFDRRVRQIWTPQLERFYKAYQAALGAFYEWTGGEPFAEPLRWRPGARPMIATTAVSKEPTVQVDDRPLVSIITPSYNMAPFLEETIQSVLSQDYPYIEYIVMDGGSTDGSLEILKRYEGRLRYVSEPDRGQTEAINKGFALSKGHVFAFLCADDTYLPGAVTAAVRHMVSHPEHGGVYGEGYLTDEKGARLGRYPTRAFDPELLKTECFICQPAAFLWRDAFQDAGVMNVDLRWGLDYDLWIRFARRHTLLKIDDYLATSRMHRGSKTLRERAAVFRASMVLLKVHYGYVPYSHVYGYCCALLDRRDGFFEPVPPSLLKYGAALLCGSMWNRHQLKRYWKEWLQQGSPRLSAHLRVPETARKTE